MRPLRTASFPALLSVFVIQSCTSSTELSREIHDPDVDFQRTAFAALYPESPHIAAVRSGTVVAGMDTTAVAAAWGAPQARDAQSITSTEWVYFEIDPDSHDPVDYVLQFDAGLLTKWDVRVHDTLAGHDIVFEHWLERATREKQIRDSQSINIRPAVPYEHRPKPKKEEKKQ